MSDRPITVITEDLAVTEYDAGCAQGVAHCGLQRRRHDDQVAQSLDRPGRHLPEIIIRARRCDLDRVDPRPQDRG